MGTVIEGFRTRLRPGAADDYRRVHASIPEPLAAALEECGLVSWRIWIDGETLFHAIETRDGRETMVERMMRLPPKFMEINSGQVEEAIDAHAIQPYYTVMLAEEAGMTLTAVQNPEDMVFTAEMIRD